MEEKKNTKVAVKTNVGDQVISRVNDLVNVSGFKMPSDYSYVNAIKMALMKLDTLKDKNNKPCLDVCSHESISKALFKMACQGLDLTKDQCYASIWGDELQINPEYFGYALMLQRLYPSWEPIVRVVREGDIFETMIDPTTGKESILKHSTTLSNKDNDFVGSYMYLPSKDGKPNLYTMTKKQIMTAWSQSKNSSLNVHKKFDEKMVIKTTINTGCSLLIKSTPELQVPNFSYDSNDDDIEQKYIDQKKEYVDFEEVDENPKEEAYVDTETGEIKQEEPTF